MIKKAIQIAAAYVGTVVGAGFATGQEIMQFFTIYGEKSFYAVLLTTVLFIVLGIRIMELGKCCGSSSYGDITEGFFGKKIGKIVNLFMMLALIVTTAAMLAGAGALFEEQFSIPLLLGVFFTGILTVLTIIAGIKGLMSVNVIFVPIMVLFSCILMLFTLWYHNHDPVVIQYQPVTIYQLVNTSLMYVSFNIILSIGVLGPLGSAIRDKKPIILGGVLGGLILGVLIASSNYCMLVHSPEIFEFEIPIVYMVLAMGSGFHLFYSLVVWGEIFTTLIASVFSLVKFFQRIFKSRLILSVGIVAISYMISRLGFSRIVGSLYPVIGFIGLIFMILILSPSYLNKMRQRKNGEI
ncbi:MAG: hypothetical protein ACOX6S_09435 [Clostridia bacterium]|jgi:uncharacterized membrane protein YkvI